MRTSSNRLSFLDRALAPVSQKQRMAGDPYFMGWTEREWKGEMDDIRRDITRGDIDVSGVMRDLNLQDPNEAKAFVDYVQRSKGKRGTRHEALGVPHAFSSEDVYRAGIAASNNGARVSFGNQDNFMGTDLTMAINNLNQGVDVQNRQGNVLSLGYFMNMDPSIVPSVMREATNDTQFRQVLGEILDKSKGKFYSDKLFQTARREGDSGKAKDFLVGGMYKRGDVQNVMRKPTKGSYDFVRPRDIHQVDLSKLRGALEQLTVGDMKQNGVRILQAPGTDLDSKLKLSLPMNFVNEVARTDGLIDKELVDYITR